MIPAIFLDKDGTLVHNVPYNTQPSRLKFFPDTIPTLRRFQKAGHKLIVISNQSALAQGFATIQQLNNLMNALSQLLTKAGVKIHGYYICPHHPAAIISDLRADCSCRKPSPGLIQAAAFEHDIDLARSWMIGDILDDIEAGHRAGCRAALLDNGGETQWVKGPHRIPDHIAPRINLVAHHILQEAKKEAMIA